MAQLAQDRSLIQLRNARTRSSYPADWYIEDDETVPQSVEHQAHEVRLQSLLRAWVTRTDRNWLVGCELAFRWDPKEPRVGVDPDVYLVEMPPCAPNGNIYRVRTWEPGNSAPILAIEIVSPTRPGKDYTNSPEKHDCLGTFELWTFDPDLLGHSPDQPAVYLQIFQRETNARLTRTYAGAGPVFSDALDAWVMVIDGELVISNDPEGKNRWLTLEETALLRAANADKRADDEAKRAAKEAKRAAKEAKRADDAEKRARAEQTEKEKALARIAELEALLAKRG